MPSQFAQHTLLTVEEVAQLLRLKPSTVYQAASEGRIPSVKLWKGRRRTLVRFRRDDILQFIHSRQVPKAASQNLGQ